METKRKWYPKKSQWIRARAAELRAQRQAYVPSSNWRGVRANAAVRDWNLREASRLDRVAERLEAAGQ